MFEVFRLFVLGCEVDENVINPSDGVVGEVGVSSLSLCDGFEVAVSNRVGREELVAPTPPTPLDVLVSIGLAFLLTAKRLSMGRPVSPIPSPIFTPCEADEAGEAGADDVKLDPSSPALDVETGVD